MLFVSTTRIGLLGFSAKDELLFQMAESDVRKERKCALKLVPLVGRTRGEVDGILINKAARVTKCGGQVEVELHIDGLPTPQKLAAISTAIIQCLDEIAARSLV